MSPTLRKWIRNVSIFVLVGFIADLLGIIDFLTSRGERDRPTVIVIPLGDDGLKQQVKKAEIEAEQSVRCSESATRRATNALGTVRESENVVGKAVRIIRQATVDVETAQSVLQKGRRTDQQALQNVEKVLELTSEAQREIKDGKQAIEEGRHFLDVNVVNDLYQTDLAIQKAQKNLDRAQRNPHQQKMRLLDSSHELVEAKRARQQARRKAQCIRKTLTNCVRLATDASRRSVKVQSQATELKKAIVAQLKPKVEPVLVIQSQRAPQWVIRYRCPRQYRVPNTRLITRQMALKLQCWRIRWQARDILRTNFAILQYGPQGWQTTPPYNSRAIVDKIWSDMQWAKLEAYIERVKD